jgi:acyl-CoA dehydrogenase
MDDIDALLDDEPQDFRRRFRLFLQEHVVPNQATWRTNGCVSRDVWREAGAAGFLRGVAREGHGGPRGDIAETLIICEELSRIHEVGFGLPLHRSIVLPFLEQLGTPSQRDRYLSRCANGECITAFAVTEPSGGSDVAAIKTTARRVDGSGEWILDGEKTFIGNGQLCDLMLVVAADPEAPSPHWGLSLFLVDSSASGFERGRNLPTIGMAGQDTSDLRFRNCVLPPDALLGQEGRGFQYLMERLPRERLIVSALAQARAERVVEETLEYIKRRQVFGRTLGSLQVPAFAMAECQIQLAVGRAFLERVVGDYVSGLDVETQTAMAKLWHTEMFFDVADKCVQLWGAHGTNVDNAVARAFVDARMQRIYAGSNEVMKLIVARSLGLG